MVLWIQKQMKHIHSHKVKKEAISTHYTHTHTQCQIAIPPPDIRTAISSSAMSFRFACSRAVNREKKVAL